MDESNNSRRRFLKYSLYTTGVAAASVIGYELYGRYVRRQRVPNIVLPTTEQMSNTSTTPAPKVNLYGKAFHDYDGDGKRDGNEPFVEDVKISLKNMVTGEEFSSVTDSDGGYEIDNLPAGEYKIFLSGEYPEEDFKFWSDSAAVYESYPYAREGRKAINDDTEYDFALMIGPFTTPFANGTRQKIISCYDVDRRQGSIRDWYGNLNTYDQHEGTDYKVGVGTPVLAAAPGIVSYVYDNWSKQSPESLSQIQRNCGNYVVVRHVTDILTYFGTGYFHLSDGIPVHIDQKVSRGELIGYSGDTGIDWRTGRRDTPHLHLQLSPYYDFQVGIDFYRDLGDPKSRCFWTKDNDPQFPDKAPV